MIIGKLKNLITFEGLSQAKDSSGGMVDSWVQIASVWAQIKNLSGNERTLTASGGQSTEARTEFTIRYLQNINTKHRIAYNGMVYNIKHINDWNEEHSMMIITCDTGLNDGR